MQLSDIKLDLQIPNGLQGLSSFSKEEQSWTLAEAFANIQKLLGTRQLKLINKSELDEKVSEHVRTFRLAVEVGRTPTIGEVVAAWLYASMQAVDAAWLADEDMSYRRYGALRAAVTRQVVDQRF
jgi:hypothetical protein